MGKKTIPNTHAWVEEIHKKFLYDDIASYATTGNYVVVVDRWRNTMGYACCSKEDHFNLQVGTAIAYARLRGLPIHPAYASKKDKVLGRDD